MGWDGVSGVQILTNFFSHDFFTFFFLPFPSFFVYHVIIEMAKLMIVIHKFKYWLARHCNVWKNGIYWENVEVEVIVEITEDYHCVTVITSMIDNIKKSCKVFNEVIKVVLKLSDMQSFKCEEYLIAPSNVAKACSYFVSERSLYKISEIARSVLAKCKVSHDSNTKKVGIEQIVGVNDPFFALLLQ